jgi:hypothetical protein
VQLAVASTGTGVVAVAASRAAAGGGRCGWSPTGGRNVAKASQPILFSCSRLLSLNLLPLKHTKLRAHGEILSQHMYDDI